MKFFNNLERKLGRYAIRNLMYYIMILYGIGVAVQCVMPGLYFNWLSLNGSAILHGQIWRVVTFLIYPPFSMGGLTDIPGLFFNVIIISMYYSLGSTLERVWGSFKFNAYFLLGIIGHVLAAIILYLLLGSASSLIIMTPVYLNFSLFLAFAFTFPDVQFMLMMVIPIKAKYLAIAEAAIYLYSFIAGGLITRVEVGMSLLNVVVFILLTTNFSRISPKEIKRKQTFKAQTKIVPPGSARHRCAVCGRTEKDGADLEFRFCSKCAGSYEYCQDHLYTHKHITAEDQQGGSGLQS